VLYWRKVSLSICESVWICIPTLRASRVQRHPCTASVLSSRLALVRETEPSLEAACVKREDKNTPRDVNRKALREEEW
jgi:hypothetical protein